MATGVHIQEPRCNVQRREDENTMDQARNIILSKVPVEENIRAGDTPIEPPNTLETDLSVEDLVKGNEYSASTIEGEKFLKSPSAAEVYFEENNLESYACQVTENPEKIATKHDSDVSPLGEAKLEVASTREVGNDESIPVNEAGLSENKEDREGTFLEKEVAAMESLNVNPEDTKACVTDHNTDTTSSIEEKNITSTPQVIPGEKIEQATFDTKVETPENISTTVPNEGTEENSSIEVDDSQKTDENLEKENEKPESFLTHEGKIEDEELRQKELFETKNDAEDMTHKVEEVTEKRVESSPVAASEAEEIKASTSDHDTKTSALENQTPTENPQEIEGDKSECKIKKETLEEQAQDISTLISVTGEDDSQTNHEAHLEKESEKPCFTDASTRDASHYETAPVDKVQTEDEEQSKSHLFENKEDTESMILVEEPIMEKHLKSSNETPHAVKTCDSVQDMKTESSIKEKILTATQLEISGDKREQTAFDTNEETPEDASTIVSNEETEQNSTVEVPFSTEAFTMDNVSAISAGKIKDEDLMEEDLFENDTESELLKQEEVMEKSVESLQLAKEAEDTKVSNSDHDTETSVLENQILTENPQEIVGDDTHSKTCDVVDAKKETLDVQGVSKTVSNDDNEDNSAIEEDESEKPLLKEESTRDAFGGESTYTNEDKIKGEDQRKVQLFENPDSAESTSLIEEATITKLVDSPQADAEDIKTHVSDQDTKTTGLILAFEGKSNDGEPAVKYEVKTEDDDQNEDKLFANEKIPESSVLLETAQIEKPNDSLQETLPSTVPRGFLDVKTEEKTMDEIEKDKDILDVQNVATTVSNDKIEDNSLIQVDGSQIQHEEYLVKESEIPSVSEASTKHANDDEMIIIQEDKNEHDDHTKVELLEHEKDTEINLQKCKAHIESPAKSLQVAAEDIIASNSYDGTETTSSQDEHILNDNEIDHEQAEVETIDTTKETPEAQDVSKTVLNDVNEENPVMLQDDSQMKTGELGKESEEPSFIETSRMDASGDELRNKSEDEIEGEQTRAELFEDKKDTESTLFKTYVSDQGTKTTCQVEVFEGVSNDDEPEVERKIKTEDRDQKKDELCVNEKIPESTLLLEVAQLEKPFESSEEALPTLVPRGFLDEKTEEKTIDATEKNKELHDVQNVTTIVSNENIDDDSLLEVDDSQIQCKDSEEESEITSIIEASTKNVNDDGSLNVHQGSIEQEDLRKDELVESEEDKIVTSQKKEAQVETPVESLNIAVEDIIASDSCQKTETCSQEERISNEEEILYEQTAGETLDTADTKTRTPTTQDVSTIVPINNIEENSATVNYLQMKNEENTGKEREKPCVIEASTTDASGDESTNKCQDKLEGEEQTGAELFEDQKIMKSILLNEEEIMVKLVESPQVDNEDIKTYVSEEGVETAGIVEAFEWDANDTNSAVKYKAKTEDNDQKEDELCDNEKNPESGVLLEAAQIETPIESLQETLSSTVPRGLLDDKTEEKTMDAIEKDKEILDVQNVATTVSNDKIEDNSLIQVDGSQIQHEEYLEKGSEIPSVIEASTKHANGDEMIIIHEDNNEHDDPRKIELVECKKDKEINLQKDEAQIETPVKSLQVAAEDIIASDSYHRTETTSSQEEQILNENEIVHEQAEVETLDTKKETPEAQNFATIPSSEHNKENSRILEDGSKLKHDELFEKESKATALSEALTMEANDEVPTIINQDKIEDEKLETVDKSECDKHEEVTLLNQEAPAEKPNESSREYLEDIKDIVSGANTTERSLVEVQSLNENPREIVGDNIEENIVDPEVGKIEDEHLEKVVTFKNEKHIEIALVKEEEPVKKLQESTTKDLEETEAFVSHEGPETISSIEERDLTEISQESVGDQSEDKKLAKVHGTPDFTPIVSDEHAKKSSIQPDGSQMKHEEVAEKDCEMLSTSEISFLNSSNNESTTVHEEKIESENLNNVEKFEDEKNIKIALMNDEAPAEKLQEYSKRDLEEVKGFVSWEGTKTSSIEERGLTEISQETVPDQLEEKIIDEVEIAREFTIMNSDENGENIPWIPVDGSQIKHEELLEKEVEISPLSEPLLRNSNSEESSILHQDKIEDELLNEVDKFESEKHAEISLIKEEAPLEKLNGSSSREDLKEIKAFNLPEDIETSSTGGRNLTAVTQENVGDQPKEKVLDIATEAPDFTTVDATQIKHEELVERENETPALPLLNSSNEKSAIVHTGKIEVEVLEKADKFECVESGEATMSNEEASAEKLAGSSQDLEDIKDSIICEGTEITSSTEEQNLTNSQEIVDDQVEEKVLNIPREASDCTTIIPDKNTEKNSLIQVVDASQMKYEEHLEKESEMPSLLMLSTSTEEPTIVAEINLSNEEALENCSKQENEDTKASVSCEDTETSSIEQQSLIADPREFVGDQTKEKIIDVAQNAQDLTTLASDENAEENSLIQLDGSQIKHEEPLVKESETPSLTTLNTTIEESTILQDCKTDENPKNVDKFEFEEYVEATLLKENTLAEKVTESEKQDEDTKVYLSCEHKDTTSSIEEPSQNANQQELVVDQIQENIFDSTTEDFKQTVSNENAGENSLIQVDELQVKHETVGDQTQENLLDTAAKDQDFQPAISHENNGENLLIRVDELQMKHDGIMEKENETPSSVIADTNNEESRITYEDIIEDENLKKVHHFECEKHEEINSTQEEAPVNKVNESSKEDLEDLKELVSGENTETTGFVEKQSLKENPQEILSDQQEEKILDIAPEAQNFIKVVSNENVDKDSLIQEDGSQMACEEILEKEGETPSLSAALMLNTHNEDSIVIHKNKIENEDLTKVHVFEYEKHADDKVPDGASEAPELKIIVSDENTEENSWNQVDKSQTKHEELLEKESKALSLSETSLLNTSNEDSTITNEDKIEDEYLDKFDKLECEKHTEFPLTKEEAPLQKLNRPLEEDLEDIKAFVSCVDTETTSSMEDRSLQTNPQKVQGDRIEDNIIDTTPEPQKFTTFTSDENTKENLSLDIDDSQIKHEEFSEKESEKPSSSMLKTSKEESSFIRNSKPENEDLKRDDNLKYVEDVQMTMSKGESSVEKLEDILKEGPETIKASVSSEDIETASPVQERSLTENPQENLTEDKILDIIPEARELKTVVSDKNIEEHSFILEDGSQMKHEECLEKESKMPSLSETSILNTRSEEPTLILDHKIEDEDQTKVNKSECEKHTENTEEVSVENPNSSNMENIEAFVSCEDIETTNSTKEQSLTVNPKENVVGQKVEKVLDNSLETSDFTTIAQDENDEDNSLVQVDGSQMKHEEPLEKESKVPSLSETSLLNTNNEESVTIHKDKIEDETLKAYVSYQDTEASAPQEEVLNANPQDILGDQSEDKFIDTADSKKKITEQNLKDSNENVVQDSLNKIDESEIKHEEILEKDSEIPYLTRTSTEEANNKESTVIQEDMIEEESGVIIESTPLNEGSWAYESVESLQVFSENIKASVSSHDVDTTSSILNANPQEISGDKTDGKINTASTRELTLEALNLTTVVSNEKEILDSIIQQDAFEINHEEILEKESEVPFFIKTSMLADNEDSTIIHEDTIEGEDLKKVDTFKSAQQTENTLSKEEAHEDESMESLQVAFELIKTHDLCQDTGPTSYFEERSLTTTPQEIVGDQVEEKLAHTTKTWEKTSEVSTSILVFQEDEAKRTGADGINSGMTKDEETLNRDKSYNAAENDEICASDKVQAKEEEKEMISERESDEEADKDDSWIKLTEDDTNKTYIELKKIGFSSHAKDTFDIAQHDGAKDIPKGNENSIAKNEFLEEGYSKESTESSTCIVSKYFEQRDKDKKEETMIAESGTASNALPITGVQCEQEESESEDSKAMESETSLAPEDRENQVQLTKLHGSPLLSHVKDSEQEMAQKRGRDNLQSGSDINDDMQELDESFVAISNKENFFEANSNENIETGVTTGAKEASAIQMDPVSEFVVWEIQEQPGKTVENVPEETDKVAPSDTVCGSTSDAGKRSIDQETPIVVQDEQKPGKGKTIEAVPEEKGINLEADEIKEHDFNVSKENSRIVALDKVTPVNFLQGFTTDTAQRGTGEETPEQPDLDEAGLKEIEACPASTTDKLTVLKANQIDNANFNSSVGSNKIPVLKRGDSSESSQAEGEKQKTSKIEKGEKLGNEETTKPMETSESTEMDKTSLSGLLQEPVKEVTKIVDHLVVKKEPTTQKEELITEKSDEAAHVEAKTDEEKDGEEESGEHQISNLSSDTLVMVDAGGKYVKLAHKKSHNIFYGVGSKVKRSISKVKKAITGQSSHPKSAYQKYSEKI